MGLKGYVLGRRAQGLRFRAMLHGIHKGSNQVWWNTPTTTLTGEA